MFFSIIYKAIATDYNGMFGSGGGVESNDIESIDLGRRESIRKSNET